MRDNSYLRGTQTKKCKMLFVSERYSTKDIYREKCIQNKFNGEMYVYYKYGSSQSRQRGIRYLLISILDNIL